MPDTDYDTDDDTVTVRSYWRMACPQCGEYEALDIVALVNVRLTPDGTDPDEAKDGGHEWDANSHCRCCDCGFGAPVWDFKL